MLEYILFDLDNTLYPKSLGIFDQILERIRNYMEICLGIEKKTARELRQEYIQNYGSTLRGLQIHHNVDPGDYLEYVHDVGVEKRIDPNPSLAKLLQSIPCGKVIFTSGSFPHALKVLRCLGVDQYFTRIFDIASTRYIPKPDPQAYYQILDALGISGQKCMMIDDLLANLQPAKELGMVTVQVSPNLHEINGYVDYTISDILELEKLCKKLDMDFNDSPSVKAHPQ